MANENPVRRMTLRQMLTQTDKTTRDLHEHIYTSLMPQLGEFRDLCRPVRRRSHYPKMVAVQNALRKLLDAGEEISQLTEHLQELLTEIRAHAKRELVNRA